MRVVFKDKREDKITVIDDAKSIKRNDKKQRFEVKYNNCDWDAFRDYDRYDLIETIPGFDK